jgi:predicted permease
MLPLQAYLPADLRHALRRLRKAPGFTLIVVAILALGIGSNTAVFSLIDALLLRSLNVPAPHELVRISFGPSGTPGPLSGPMLDRLRERQSAFSDLFAWTNSPMALKDNEITRPIRAAYATGSAFPTLELNPRLGRLLNWRDDELRGISSGFAAVISETFWKEHFHARLDTLGTTIIINGLPAEIVGVMPQSFNGITVDYEPQVVLPFAFDVALNGQSSGRFHPGSTSLFVMGRLKSGVSYKQAQANIATIAGDVLKEAIPLDYQRTDYFRSGRLTVSPGSTGISPLGMVYGRPLWTLQALVSLLMLICCANLASLQVSRSLQRMPELVVCSALGANRLRLSRELVVESLILAILGASFGLLLSQWMSLVLVRYVEQSDFPVFLDLRPNIGAFVWTIGLATLTVILAGVLPALSVTRFDTDSMLRSGTQRTLARTKRGFTGGVFALQIALSLLLLSLALLFGVSTGKLLGLDPGFRVKGVTLLPVDFERRAEHGDARIELYRKMLDVLRSSPGVEAASLIAVPPLRGAGIDEGAIIVGGTGSEEKHLFANIVGTNYFATMGTRLLEGREFSEFDRFGMAPVCILNQSAANLLFGNQNAMNQRVRSVNLRSVCEIVGVATDAKYLSLRQPAPPTIYYAYDQLPDFGWPGFVTRGRDTSASIGAFKEILRRFARETPVLPAVTMQHQVEYSVGQERLLAALSLFFGGMALLLTSIGLYGLEAQRVSQRRAEIGLRMALGAREGDVWWFILREAVLLFAVGMPIGLAMTILASRFVGVLLYNISPLDPRIYGAAALVMLGVGFLAAYLPSRSATRISPMQAIRME